MKERVYVVSPLAREALGALRGFPSLRVGVIAGGIWLRGCASADEHQALLKQVPVSHSYDLDAQGYYFPRLGLTPVGQLTNVEWMPLTQFIRPTFPTAAMPGQVREKYPVRVVPSVYAEKGSALLCSLSTWKSYADTAPEVRLSRLHFAVSQSGQVIIWGSPLPAIPGQEYWQRGGILLPCGYDFEIPFVAGLLARQLNPENDSVLLFHADGTWDLIARKHLFPVTRSGVRLTKEDPTDGF